MVSFFASNCRKIFLLFGFLVFSISFYGQEQPLPKPKSDFWRHVKFGGGLALNFSTGYSEVSIAPMAIYNFNEKFGLGTGINYSYLNQKNYYTSNLIGVSLIGLYNPVPFIQLSTQLDEANVSNQYNLGGNFNENFWNTALFLGAGYRSQNVTFGVQYNVLFDRNRNIYGDAFMPFVRVYF